MTMPSNLTTIIITKNEAAMLAACLETLSFSQHIIVVDNNSTDETASIAEHYGCQVLNFASESFASLRDKAIVAVKTDWLMYIDADERVSPALAKEILSNLDNKACQAMTFKRDNVCYGQQFFHGNWQNDLVTRVFRKNSLQGWFGEIHESPKFDGQALVLNNALLHLTHRSTQENLYKSAAWTIKEAELLAQAQIKPVTFALIIRKGVMEFYRRVVRHKAYKDGLAGMIEALVQAINRAIVYIQVWELQQKPSLPKLYQAQEQKMRQLWKAQGKLF